MKVWDFFVFSASRLAAVADAFLACQDVTKNLQTKRQDLLAFLLSVPLGSSSILLITHLLQKKDLRLRSFLWRRV